MNITTEEACYLCDAMDCFMVNTLPRDPDRRAMNDLLWKVMTECAIMKCDRCEHYRTKERSIIYGSDRICRTCYEDCMHEGGWSVNH
jgi:hypothetical protein